MSCRPIPARTLGWILFTLPLVASLPVPAQGEPAGPQAIPRGDQEIAQEIQKYWNLMEERPDDPSLHTNLGNLYAVWGWNSDALVEFHKALALDPGSSMVWTNMGTLYTAMENESKAIKAFRKAIRLNPNEALAYYNLATLYGQRGRFDKSVELYKRAIDINPSLADIERNPHVVYNAALQVVLLERFREQAELKSMPLHWIPIPHPDDESNDKDADQDEH